MKINAKNYFYIFVSSDLLLWFLDIELAPLFTQWAAAAVVPSENWRHGTDERTDRQTDRQGATLNDIH